MNALRFLGLCLILGCGHSPKHGDHHHEHGHDNNAGYHHRFDDAEKWSAVFDDPKRDAWQMPDEVVAKSDVRAGHVVADIGAGTGYFVGHLSRAVGETGRVLALDVEKSLIDHMTARIDRESWSNATARLVAPDDPGLDAQSVDRVLIVDTWHHIGDRVAYATKLKAALREGGRVVVVDFTMDAPDGPPKKHRILPAKVAEELAAAGFRSHVVETTLPRQYIVVGER